MSHQIDFGQREEGKYNVILKVEDREFFVMRQHLGLYSPVLTDILCKAEDANRNEEIELNDATAEGFQTFLEIINGKNNLSDKTIENVLKLSHNWKARIPLEACHQFLLQNSTLNPRTKFALADKFNIVSLKIKVLQEVISKTHLNSILPESVENLQQESLVLVFQKARELLRDHSAAPALGVPAVGRAAQHGLPVQHGPTVFALPHEVVARNREILQVSEAQRTQELAQAQERARQLDQQLVQANAELEIRERAYREAAAHARQLLHGPSQQTLQLQPGVLRGQALRQSLDRLRERNRQQVQVDTLQRALRDADRHVLELTQQLARLRALQQDQMQMVQGWNGQGDVRPQMRPGHGDLPPRDLQQ